VDLLSPPGVDPFDPAASAPVDKTKTHTSGWGSFWKFASRHLPNWLFELAEIAYNVVAALRLRRVLSENRYDIVFERYAFFLLAGARETRRAGCRFLLEVNEVSGIPGRARRQSFVRLCARLERRLLRHCDLVHAVSSYLGERLVDAGLDRSKLVVIPNGFDISRLKLTRTRNDVRDALGLSNALVVGFAGWFDHWDRLDLLVDVFAKVAVREPRLKLCLIGDGPAGAALHARARDLGVAHRIVLVGAVPRKDVYDYMQIFDIGVLAHSNVFGSPIVMFEMMGLRIPLVLPRLQPIEDVHVHRETALLFDPLDASGCAEMLGELVEGPELRRRLAESAVQKLATQHTWQSTAQAILEPLRPVLG
jgi:glycosyltransferase involved in cell wall biosynthesis